MRARRVLLAGVGAWLGMSSLGLAQTTASWVLPIDGSWTDATKWSTNPLVPNGNYSVTLPGGGNPYTVRLSTDISLANLSIGPSVEFLPLNGTLDVFGSLTLAGSTITLGGGTSSGVLRFSGTQTLGGDGVIRFDGGAANIVAADVGQKLTIGQGVTIRTNTSGGEIGYRLSHFENRGTISSQTPGKTITLSGTWRNQGVLQLSDGSLVLGGTFSTAGLGQISRSGGTLAIAGYLDNSGSSLHIAPAVGSMLLAGGVIKGGSLTTGNGMELVGAGTLDAVVIAGSIRARGPALWLTNNTIAAPGGRIYIGGDGFTDQSMLMLQPNSDLGPVEVSFEGSYGGSVRTLSGTLLIGPGTTVRTGSANGNLGLSSQPLVNQGTILSGTAGHRIEAEGTVYQNFGHVIASNGGSILFSKGLGTPQFQNSGTLSANAGGLIFISPPASNSGSILAHGGAITLSAGWSNSGLIDAAGGTLTLNNSSLSIGSIAAASSYVHIYGNSSASRIAPIVRSFSTFSLGENGVFDNSGNTLVSDPNVNTWDLRGTTISGGTLMGANGGAFSVVQGSSTLSNVGIAPGTAINTSSATLVFQNAGAIEGTNLGIRGNGTIVVGGNQIVGANTTVSFSAGSIGNTLRPTAGTLTLAPGSIVRNESTGGGTIGGNAFTVRNQGTIRSQSPFSITLPGVFINEGLVHTDGGAVRLTGDWSNTGSMLAESGLLNLGGTFTSSSLASIRRVGTAGSIAIAGYLDNTTSTLELNEESGSWHLGSGTIAGGTLTTSGSARFLTQSSSLTTTLLRTALRTEISVLRHTLDIQEGLYLNDGQLVLLAVNPAYNATLRFTGAQTLDGNGTIILNSVPSSIARVQPASGTLTLGNGIVIRSAAGSGTIGATGTGNGVINQGMISSPTNLAGIIFLGDFSNLGLLQAQNGGTLNLNSATLSNLSGTTLSGGRWAVYANSTMTMGTSTITTNNADILLDGPNSTFVPINSLLTNLGTFAIDHGRNFTTAGSLSNSGWLGIGTNSTMFVSGQLNNTGSIDLIGTLIVDYAPGEGESSTFDTLAGQIGTNILTSLLDPAKGIGSADNAELLYTSFGGMSVDTSSVLLKLTYLGDADLDGVTDLDDFDHFLTGFAPTDASPTWLSGDFDYSGVVNLTDFELYLHGYYALGGSSSAIASAVQSAPVSESDR